jgi:hypothetical protein
MVLAALAGAAVLSFPATAGAASVTLTVKTERGYVVSAGKKAGIPAYKALYSGASSSGARSSTTAACRPTAPR